MKEEQETQQENTEQDSESSSNFLGEIPESWKRRARAAFGYAFCVMILIAVSFEIAAAIFPAVQWLTTVSKVVRQIGSHLYHYGVGLGVAIVAPCLVWENVMYLREKRRREREQRAREREQRAREQAEAVVAELREREQRAREHEQRAREQAEAVVAELRERVRALEEERLAREQAETVIAQLQKEVTELRRELDAANAQSHPPREDGEN